MCYLCNVYVIKAAEYTHAALRKRYALGMYTADNSFVDDMCLIVKLWF